MKDMKLFFKYAFLYLKYTSRPWEALRISKKIIRSHLKKKSDVSACNYHTGRSEHIFSNLNFAQKSRS